jgi:hypothetical protein
MKLFRDQVAYNPGKTLKMPVQCCCCLRDFKLVKRMPYSVEDSRHGGTYITHYSLGIPLCEECFQHSSSRQKSGMFRIIIYVVFFLILWGMSALITLKPEIWVTLYLGVVLLSEIYWRIRYFKYEKYMKEQGHTCLRDFVDLRIKSPDLAILTFKSEVFAELVRKLNKGFNTPEKHINYRE